MYDIISIGTATRDVYLTSPLFKIVRDPEHLVKIGFPTGEAECFAMGSKIDIDTIVMTTGGGATNTAVTFSRQGLRSAAVITVGSDGAGAEIITELKKEGVVPFPIIRRGEMTAYSTILLAESGERTILSYRNPKDNVRIADIPLSKLKSRWAYIAPGTIDFNTLDKLTATLAKNKTLIAINPSKHFIEYGTDKVRPILARTKALILNREEGSYITGIPYEREREIFKNLDELVEGIAVMTDGPNGVIVSDGTTLWRAGIFKEERIVDRTGAGDAFGSAFIAGLMHKKEECAGGVCADDAVQYAIRLASANATSKVEHIGAKGGLLTKKEFERSPRWKTFSITSETL